MVLEKQWSDSTHHKKSVLLAAILYFLFPDFRQISVNLHQTCNVILSKVSAPSALILSISCLISAIYTAVCSPDQSILLSKWSVYIQFIYNSRQHLP